MPYQQYFSNSNDHCSCLIFYFCFPSAFANHTSVYGLSWHFFHISLKNSELTTLRDCRVLFFDNLSRNSCIQLCSLYVGSAKREPFVIMHNVVVPLLAIFSKFRQIYLDIMMSKAFDKVNHAELLGKLRQ